jgi:hypothetical protein
MRHLILGLGNLGYDIRIKLESIKHKVDILSKSTGWEYPTNGMAPIMTGAWDVIWCCIGAGSVGGDFMEQLDQHVRLTYDLLTTVPKSTAIIFFSTNYVFHPSGFDKKPVSLYGLSKKWMEKIIRWEGRPRTRIIRVQNLYGTYKPVTTLPWKLISKLSESKNIVPNMLVCPTPTWWLAEQLVNREMWDGESTIDLMPGGSIKLIDLAKLINPEAQWMEGKAPTDRPWAWVLGKPEWVEESWGELWNRPENEFFRQRQRNAV